jgi:hypothetical protein
MPDSCLFSKSFPSYAFVGFCRSQLARLMRTIHCAAISIRPADITPLLRASKLDAQSLSHRSSHPNPSSSSLQMFLSKLSPCLNCDRYGTLDVNVDGRTLISSTVLISDSVMVWTRRCVAIRMRRLCFHVSNAVSLGSLRCKASQQSGGLGVLVWHPTVQ